MVERRRAHLLAALTVAMLAVVLPVRADSVSDVHTGNAAFGEGRYEAAVDAFTRAILAGDLSPEAMAITFNNRGVAYSELGDYDRAIQDYAQALKLVPGDPTAIKNMRIAHIRRATSETRLGEQDQALADYDRAVELDPSHPLAYLRRGQLQLERGNAAAALTDLTRAQALDPANADIGPLLAEAQRATAEQAKLAAGPAPETPGPGQPAPPATTERSQPTPAPTVPPSLPTAPPVAAAPTAVEPAAGPVSESIGPERRYRALSDVNLRDGPSNDAARIDTLAQGTEVQVDGESLGWLRVRLPDQRYGYVYKRWLEPLPTQP